MLLCYWYVPNPILSMINDTTISDRLLFSKSLLVWHLLFRISELVAYEGYFCFYFG